MKNNRVKFLALLALLLVGLFVLTSVSPVVLAKDDKKAKTTEAKATEAKATEKVPDNEAKVEGKINVYTRDNASGTREGFEKVVGIKKT